MSNELNVKNFILTIKSSMSYQLSIDGFSKTSQWFIVLAQKVSMVSTALLTLKAETSLPIKLSIVTGTVFLTTKMASVISNSVVLSGVAKLTYKITSTMSEKITFVVTSSAISRVVATTVSNLNTMVATILAGVFNPLSDYDAGTLGAIDASTLSAIEFTAT